jgi:hypothetical protein
MTTVSPVQVIAFRVAAQGLGARGADPLAVLSGGWTVQDSPPGAAAAALCARVDGLDAGWLDGALGDERNVVALYNPRTAMAIVPASEVASFAAALLPRDEEGWRLVLGRAIPPAGEGIEPVEALAVALPAFEAALDGGPLSRDDLHQALRERLPEELLPWCDGCQSHHARRGLLVAACLHGRLCIAGRAGRQPLFARTDRWMGPASDPAAVDWESAAAELVRRYLRWHGPATPELFAQWAGLPPVQARASWELVAGELTEVEVAGRGAAWLLTDDLPALDVAAARAAGAHSASGGARSAAGGGDGHDDAVRLLAAGDPLLLARDRELLVPDRALRRRIWTAIGGPGIVLADGAVAALWRGRKRGRRLAVEVEPVGRALPRRTLAAVEREAERLAPHRGCATAEIAVV